MTAPHLRAKTGGGDILPLLLTLDDAYGEFLSRGLGTLACECLEQAWELRVFVARTRTAALRLLRVLFSHSAPRTRRCELQRPPLSLTPPAHQAV